MTSSWKRYFLYASLIIIGGGLVYILVETIRAKNTGFETKTLWDWMELLIIPLFLAGGAFFLNRSEKENERKAAEERAKLEREIATDRQQEISLQAYFDRMSELLLKEKLRTTKKAEVRDVARTRTISVMRGLDVKRNNLVLQFLSEARLVVDGKSILCDAQMEGMNLQMLRFDGVNMQGAFLRNANLQGANFYQANLLGSFLRGANLQGARMVQANLQGADLWRANLQYALSAEVDFTGASLGEVNLQDAFLADANLKRASLLGADLKSAFLLNANLEGTILSQANLEGANLQGAKVTREQLATAKSLKGATMPDGTIHE